MAAETFTNQTLSLTVTDEGNAIRIEWLGKSTAREPGAFIGPILVQALRRSSAEHKHLLMDFQRIEYMNSSTITPIIRILDEAKRGGNQVSVLYQKALKWQELSFTALEIFETGDGRITVRGI